MNYEVHASVDVTINTDSVIPCKDDPELWFADAEYLKREAKLKCSSCPVRLKCLEMGKDEDWGIWGGLDERDRRRMFGSRAIDAYLDKVS